MAFVNRVNRVPHYQKLFQQHDGVRQWNRGPRAKMLLVPYYAILATTATGCVFMMGRLVLGHKTWFSKE